MMLTNTTLLKRECAKASRRTDIHSLVANAAEAVSVETLAQFDYFNTQALGQLRAEGVEFLEFSADVVSALRAASTDVMGNLAEKHETFKQVMESYRAFLEPAVEYANLMQGAMYRQRS